MQLTGTISSLKYANISELTYVVCTDCEFFQITIPKKS